VPGRGTAGGAVLSNQNIRNYSASSSHLPIPQSDAGQNVQVRVACLSIDSYSAVLIIKYIS